MSGQRRKGVFGAPMRQPTIRATDPSWRDSIAQSISAAAGKVGINERNAYQATRKALSVADWLPVVGDAAAYADAGNSFSAGNYLKSAAQAGLATAGLVPGVGDAVAAGGKGLMAAALAGSVRKAARKESALNFSNGYQKAQLGDTSIEFAPRANGAVEISKVFTPSEARGRGSARTAMENLIAQADAKGVRLELTADPLDAATSKAKLEKFYKSFGFVPNKGRNKDYGTRAGMIRESR